MKPSERSALPLEIAESYEALSRQAERLVVGELKRRPSIIFCASAGGSPTRLYELLGARCQRQPRLFDRMRVLQIDEWGGLPRSNAATCESDLRVKLLEPLGIKRDRYVGFDSETRDPEAETARVAGWLSAHGPIDVCILGLGLNGHVAMNEPAAELVPHAHVSQLTRSSLNHPMLKQLRRKPRYGLTVGMGDILSSRLVLLLVNGKHKREAVEQLRRPLVTPRFPASFLWLHPRAVVLCDRDAAGAPRKRR
jgi:galactosamine-6-phosphate isomerase